MSSQVNNALSNSALNMTLQASESRMNPNVYSTRTINPSASVSFNRVDSQSGAIGASRSLTFNLPKYGIMEQLLLVYTKTAGANDNTPAYDFLNVIDRIEILSASKVIQSLTSYDLLAIYSDLDYSQYYPIKKTMIAGKTGDGMYVTNIPFGFFKDRNLNLNLQFNEPMSVRVKFGAYPNLVSTLDSCYLNMRYKAYNEADFSEILTQNYSEPQLSQLVEGMYQENIADGKILANATDNGTAGTAVSLKNTDCVNDFFVTVRERSTTASKAPSSITRVVMTASGQVIFDLTDEELYFSRICENGFAISTSDDDATKNVVKIQTGLWEHLGSGTQTNTMSLRELNNPVITVFFKVGTAPATDTLYDVVVSERTLNIVSTVSSSGRLNTLLNN